MKKILYPALVVLTATLLAGYALFEIFYRSYKLSDRMQVGAISRKTGSRRIPGIEMSGRVKSKAKSTLRR